MVEKYYMYIGIDTEKNHRSNVSIWGWIGYKKGSRQSSKKKIDIYGVISFDRHLPIE